MSVNMEQAIAWMEARRGKVTYSMDYRNGPNSYDCSSSVYFALMSAGAISAGWAKSRITSQLEKYNIYITETQLETFIESAVKQMNDAWNGE